MVHWYICYTGHTIPNMVIIPFQILYLGKGSKVPTNDAKPAKERWDNCDIDNHDKLLWHWWWWCWLWKLWQPWMEICDMGGIRSPAGHHRGSAWAAQGLLDERLPTMTITLMMKSGWWWCFDDYYLMKDSTLFCKLVKVWSFHGWACYDARINLVTDSWP